MPTLGYRQTKDDDPTVSKIRNLHELTAGNRKLPENLNEADIERILELGLAKDE